MSKNNVVAPQSFVQGRGIANSRWYMGNVMTFLVNSEQTGGAFSMTEYLSKPGNEPPAHVHGREDEVLYVLEGRIDAYVGKEVLSAGQNEGVYLPKFIPHTFRILTPQLRMLIWMSPGGLEGYFRDMSESARSLSLPEHAVNYGEVDMTQALHVGKEHGLSFLSPEEIRQQMPPLAKLLQLQGVNTSSME
jgi:mannose-6-phosphate isomerase-like protein (cupin superfamily)